MSEGQGGFAQGAPAQEPTSDPSGGGLQTNPQNNNGGIPQQQQQSQQQQETVDWGSNDFLKNVPETDREAVGRYLKMIDAGISRRFQELHDQYRPYTQLGNVEEIQQAQEIYRILNEDPQQLYQALAAALEEEDGNDPQGLGAPNDPNNPFQGLPPEFVNQFQRQQQALEAVAQWVLDQQQETQNSQADRELDQTLGQLKAEFGEFDEEYVLAKAYANGGDLAAAVKEYQGLLQKSMNGQRQLQQVPPVLGGGGTVPQENSQTVKNLDRNQTKQLVTAILAQQTAQ